MKFHYRKHKIRFDRGRMWYAALAPIITAVLVTLFISDTSFIGKVLYAFGVFLLIYIFGYIDDKMKLLDREQNEYCKRNPFLEEMAKDIREIKKRTPLNERCSQCGSKLGEIKNNSRLCSYCGHYEKLGN
jgi:hypothetical protein